MSGFACDESPVKPVTGIAEIRWFLANPSISVAFRKTSDAVVANAPRGERYRRTNPSAPRARRSVLRHSVKGVRWQPDGRSSGGGDARERPCDGSGIPAQNVFSRKDTPRASSRCQPSELVATAG